MMNNTDVSNCSFVSLYQMSAQIKIVFISKDDQLAFAYLHISAVKKDGCSF